MQYVAYFALTLAGAFLAVRLFPQLSTLVDSWIRLVRCRGLQSTPWERPKFAMIRVALGLVLSWRATDVVLHLSPLDQLNPAITLFAALNLITGLTLLVGFLSQYTLIILIVVQWQLGDMVLGTSTLGNDVAAMLAVVLFLTNAGGQISVDAWIMTRVPGLRVALLYYRNPPSTATLTAAKWLAIFSFWLVCLYSLSMHLSEAAWMTGTAGPLLLSNNFMSGPFEVMIAVFSQSSLAVYLARWSLWAMLPWYALLAPLVLAGTAARSYAIGWGVLFFALSLLVLRLGWLAEIEILLWLAVFWMPLGLAPPAPLAVAFDDRCALCDRTVQVIRLLDVFDQTRLLPISQNATWLRLNGIHSERALEDLHAVDDKTGTVISGYEFYLIACRTLVVLRPAYPIVWLGKWSGLGTRAYAWTARRRHRLMGKCSVPSRKRPDPVAVARSSDSRPHMAARAITLHLTLLGVLYAAAIPAPSLGYSGWHSVLADSAHLYGIAPIDVFNAADLRMAENWFTLSLLEDKGETLLPFLAEDGSRLGYHASDRVYFGKTLPWRRRYIDQPGCFFEQNASDMRDLAGIYLWKHDFPNGEYQLVYRQYFEPSPLAEELVKNNYRRGVRTTRCTVRFSVAWPSSLDPTGDPAG